MSEDDETRDAPERAAAPAEAASGPAKEPSSEKREEVLGAKGRRALLAKLPPLGWQGGQILDAMKLDSDGDLGKVLELTADDFLDPLWERVHGRST
jgi:hypothetical protein